MSTRPTSLVLYQEKTKVLPATTRCGPGLKKFNFLAQGTGPKTILSLEPLQPPTSTSAASSPLLNSRPSLVSKCMPIFCLLVTNSTLPDPVKAYPGLLGQTKTTLVALTSQDTCISPSCSPLYFSSGPSYSPYTSHLDPLAAPYTSHLKYLAIILKAFIMCGFFSKMGELIFVPNMQ